MRLGVVMTGVGAQAAAHVGVMRELARRGIEPYAVCGMQTGAWPAAVFCAGGGQRAMEQALLQAAAMGPRILDRKLHCSLGDYRLRGVRLRWLLRAQLGDRIMSACPKPGLFLCHTARNDRSMIFATRDYDHGRSAMLTMQSSLGFAVRAAMAQPPLLELMEWLGGALLPETDVSLACRELFSMGAQRVLVVAPQMNMHRAGDSVDYAVLPAQRISEEMLPEGVSVLRMPLPETVGVLSVRNLMEAADAGQRCAEQRLDAAFEHLGMAFCRVLPFRGQAAARTL